jgi:hypothetical protein
LRVEDSIGGIPDIIRGRTVFGMKQDLLKIHKKCLPYSHDRLIRHSPIDTVSESLNRLTSSFNYTCSTSPDQGCGSTFKRERCSPYTVVSICELACVVESPLCKIDSSKCKDAAGNFKFAGTWKDGYVGLVSGVKTQFHLSQIEHHSRVTRARLKVSKCV